MVFGIARRVMFRVIEVAAVSDFRLHLRYSDGVEGVVDLSPLAGKGVFALWNRPGGFDNVSIGPAGEVRWGDDVDLCPDALYMQLTGKSPEEIFPNLKKAETNA